MCAVCVSHARLPPPAPAMRAYAATFFRARACDGVRIEREIHEERPKAGVVCVLLIPR